MKLKIELMIESQDARTFLDSLNGDDGLRAKAAEMLGGRPDAATLAKYTRLTIVLGQLSRAFITAVEAARQPTKRQLEKLVSRSTTER